MLRFRIGSEVELSVEELRADWKPPIVQLAGNRGATQIRVYGSVARNQSGEQDDIDFCWNSKRAEPYLT